MPASSPSAKSTFGSGETTVVRTFQLGGDLLLLIEEHEPTLQEARRLAEHLGCELLELSDLETLESVLGVRRPSAVLLALDVRGLNAVAALRALSALSPPPPLLLLGEMDRRLLASAHRLAAAHGVAVLGTLSRPLEYETGARLLAPHLGAPPAIPRADLERALREQELSLLYQPVMALEPEGLRLKGVEAFVRWQHPQRGLLRPAQFLASLEREELLGALTDFVMMEAVRQAGVWRARGLALEVTINLSPRLVRDRGFPDRLEALLRENGVPPDQIGIDVTEGREADRTLILDAFTRLRLMGVGLSLDNFGTGRSSLTELYRLPFTALKIDGSLLAEMPGEPEAAIIVRSIVELAHTLGLKACAEGVETPAAVQHLREIGCDALQGRIVCSPVRASDLERLAESLRCVAYPPTLPAVCAPGAPGTLTDLRSIARQRKADQNAE